MVPMGRLARTGPALARWLGWPGADGEAGGPPGADGDVGAPGRWEVVTVDRPPEQVLPDGRLPEPLRRLDGAVEVRVRPAPGDRGTELAARPVAGVTPPTGLAAHLVGDDPGLLVRRTLRQVKQRAEAGEVLRADRSALDRPEVRG
ncbi:hypothetical protein ACWER9_25895 [Micromonospora sp. NPDC003944]